MKQLEPLLESSDVLLIATPIYWSCSACGYEYFFKENWKLLIARIKNGDIINIIEKKPDGGVL